MTYVFPRMEWEDAGLSPISKNRLSDRFETEGGFVCVSWYACSVRDCKD